MGAGIGENKEQVMKRSGAREKRWAPGVGDRIRTVREQNGKSQEQFGEKLGVSGAHISYIENEKREASEYLVLKIAHHFFVNPSWIMYGNAGGKMKVTAKDRVVSKIWVLLEDDVVKVEKFIEELLHDKRNARSKKESPWIENAFQGLVS